MSTHAKCERHSLRWTGEKQCHCCGINGCGLLFTSPSAFDAHRRGPVDARYCSLRGLVELRPGLWGRPAGSDAATRYSANGKGQAGG